MTVSSTTRRVGPHAGNGATVSFPFTFKVFTTADIELTLTDPDGAQEVLVLDSDYTVTLNGDQDANPGGSINYTPDGSPMASGYTLAGVGILSQEQATDITNLGRFLPQVIEDAFDYVVILCQQLSELVGRTLKFPVGDSASTTLPTASARALKAMVFDADGNIGVSEDDYEDQAAAAAASAAAAAAAAATFAFLYPGTYSVNPTTRPSGSAIQAGDRYVNSADGYEYIYVDGAWTNAASSAQAAAISASDAQLAKVAAQAARDALSPLAYEYETAFVIDATSDDTDAAVITKIGDAVTEQSLDEFHTFGRTAMVVREDGTVGWTPHNLMTRSGTLGNAAYTPSGVTVATGYEGPSGLLDAALLTASGAAGFLQGSAGVVGLEVFDFSGQYFIAAWKVYYDATQRWAYIRIDSPGTKRVYFDLQSGTVGTADAGLTGGISRYDGDGNLMPTGWFMLYAYQVITAGVSSFQTDIGLSNADASPVVTVGKTLRVAQPQACYGVRPLSYMETTGACRYGAAYSWETGGRTMMLYGGATYRSRYADDFTNAAWVKTNVTAALNATGIHGEPCSTLTATAANGTVLQAVTSAGGNQTFIAYVKRKTGTSAVSMTADNGATWTVLTLTTSFQKFYLHGVANPNIGFKIATSGDAVEVCLAVNASSRCVMPPFPVKGADMVMFSNAIVNKSLPVAITTKMLAYADVQFVDDTNVVGLAQTLVSFTNSGIGTMVSTIALDWSQQDASGTLGYSTYSASAGERIEATTYISGSDTGNYLSINGEPLAADHLRNTTGLNLFSLNGSGAPMQFIRRLLVSPDEIEDRDSLRTLHYQQGIRNGLYAASLVCADNEVSGTDMNREPAVEVLKDYGNSILLGVFWMQKNVVDFFTECPARLMQRNYVYDKVNNTLTPVTDATIIYENPRFDSGLGHSQSPTCIRVPSGANRGRLVLIFTNLDSVSGTLADDDRNIYMMINDEEGTPTAWGSPVKIFDATTLGYSVLCVNPSGDYVVLPPTHTVAPGRIILGFYTENSRVHTIYTDDGFDTVSVGTALYNAAPPLSESSFALWPDGTVIQTHRTNDPVDSRYWSKSVDGGVNFTLQGNMPAVHNVDVSGSTAQLDATGVNGTYGRIALSQSTEAFRLALQVGFYTDGAMTRDSYIAPVDKIRYVGYSSLKSLFGGEYLALALEAGRASSNVDNSAYLLIVKP